MKLSRIFTVIISMLILNHVALAQENTATTILLGKSVFEQSCIACHGPGKGYYGKFLPGTTALDAKYKGAVPALLTERRDLTEEFVTYIVRNGISNMPFFRKTEISVQELQALASYLSTPQD